jgi:RNase P/RNase MRP subunit POP5
MVRVKRRYFVFQFHFNSNTNTIKSSHIHTTFETIISRLYGDVGIARFTRNLSVIYYNPSTHTAIVRCLRDDKHMLQTAATFISKLNTNDQIECSIQTLHVGGSIRQCKKYLVNYCIEQLLYINSQSINQKKTTSQFLFKNKKNKTNNQHQSMDIDHDKQLALQKLLADSRIESSSIVVSKNDDDHSEK